MKPNSRAARLLASAFALYCAACGTGPTLDLGDDLGDALGQTEDAGDSRPDTAGAGSPAAEPIMDGGAPGDARVPEADAASPCGSEPACDCEEPSDCDEGEEPPDCAEGEECACMDDLDCDDPEKPFCVESRCVKCRQDQDCAATEHTTCSLPAGECE